MTREEIIAEEMESIRVDIVKQYDALGMRASGDFANETSVEQRGNKHFIVAPEYARQLVRGRKPGTMPPVAAIERWIKEKGIRSIDISTSSLAFLIARKIQREGTRYHKQGGTDLLEAVITPERMQRIIDRIKDHSIVDLQNKIIRTLKEAA